MKPISFVHAIVAALAAAAFTTAIAPGAAASAPVTDPLRRTAIVEAVEKAGPAVVNVSTERIILVRRDPFWELFGDMSPDVQSPVRRYKTTSLGSGVIIDPNGYIVTNEHVVRRASGVFVSLPNDEQVYTAQVIASHPEHDLAVIKIDPEQPLPHVEFADSDELMIGETAIAIGNPYGLESSVTTGVVSATRRSVYARGEEIFKGFIQTDAAINPGNSGGALVDIYGRLIGINTAMRYGAENIGFAIPVNKVKESLSMLLDPRRLKQLWVGFTLDHDEQGRCIVASVDEGSPAAKAGVKPGDVLVSMDARTIPGAYNYGLSILKHSVGDTIALGITRDGKARELAITLEAAPKPSGTDLAMKFFGLEVRDLTKEDSEVLEVNLEGGVMITDVEPRSPAARKGLRKGDVIIKVDRYPVPGVERLGILLGHAEAGDNVLVWVVRGTYSIGNYITAR